MVVALQALSLSFINNITILFYFLTNVILQYTSDLPLHKTKHTHPHNGRRDSTARNESRSTDEQLPERHPSRFLAADANCRRLPCLRNERDDQPGVCERESHSSSSTAVLLLLLPRLRPVPHELVQGRRAQVWEL